MIRAITLVYGEQHTRYWREASLPSLMGIDAMTLYTDDRRLARDARERLGLPVEVETIRPQKKGTQGKVMKRALAQAVKRGERVLMAPPDTVFASGTVELLRAVSDQSPGCAMAFPHPRVVDEEYLNRTRNWEGSPKTSSLLELIGVCGHPSWDLAEDGRNSLEGGIMWYKVPGGIMVHHRLPTAYLVDPRPGNADAVEGHGNWDHRWPEKLYQSGRWRVIGCDGPLAVELTPARQNVPVANGRIDEEPDRFVGNGERHAVNRCFVSFWKGDV